MEAIATDVNKITPPDGWVLAFEQVYFEARRIPPPGVENAFNPNSLCNKYLAENRFATFCMMARDPRIQTFNLFDRHAQNKAFVTPNFTIYLFWGPTGPPETVLR